MKQEETVDLFTGLALLGVLINSKETVFDDNILCHVAHFFALEMNGIIKDWNLETIGLSRSEYAVEQAWEKNR